MAESKLKFKCPVCLEVLKSPKILPCLHSFCQQCIHEIILATVQNKEPKPTQFTCPICHTVVKPRDPTVDIEKWASILQDNHVVGTAERQECHTCKHHSETSVANFWCKDCNEAFCEKCNGMHSWVKLTSSHNVIPIEDAKFFDSGFDLEVISEKCSLHPSNIVEAFCTDHEELCCVFCLTSSHRKCENVKTLSEITITKRGNETLEEVLQKMKQETDILLVVKETKLKLLKDTTEIIEKDAVKFVQTIKCKIDDLLGNFIKQLQIIQDEQDLNIQADVQFLNDFKRTLAHWISATEVIRKYGTETQFFIHSKTMIGQINENITQLGKRFIPDIDTHIFFNKHYVLTQVSDIKDIGTAIVKTTTSEDRTKNLFNLSRKIGIKAVDFEGIAVKHLRNIFIQDADITCGVSIGDNYAIVGADSKNERILYTLNIKTGHVVNTTVITKDLKLNSLKCLCFDKKSKHLFVVAGFGFSSTLLMADVNDNVIEQPLTLSFNKNVVQVIKVGIWDDDLYVVSSEKIQKFKPSLHSKVEQHFTLCLESNINTTSRINGVALRDGTWLYTSCYKQVKCLTIQGNELFSVQSLSLESPGCLTVTPSGVVVVVDQVGNGSLNAVSSNGKKDKILLQFDKRTKMPTDIWIDDRGEAICVCGGQDIMVYRIETE
ncbi:E3 ubiquitin-protein ligase Midline-1-like [Mytilus edulis]|uniref:E3 ubiquitin-protein ligase Midline-1-like n=1 Tax=Mytilus edulis TaxID=6550 RepID=UPI0039EF2340